MTLDTIIAKLVNAGAIMVCDQNNVNETLAGLGIMGNQPIQPIKAKRPRRTTDQINKERNDARNNEILFLVSETPARVMYNARAIQDQRRFIDKYIYEYKDNGGELYRKSFDVKLGNKPTVPSSGTHAEINGLQKQW